MSRTHQAQASGQGLLSVVEAIHLPCPAPCQVLEERTPLLRKAADRVRANAAAAERMQRWRGAHAWVEDSALFYCLTHHNAALQGVAWWQWPEPLRRVPAACAWDALSCFGNPNPKSYT